MQNWSQFYAAMATASAALLGLLFVAVSINAPAALGPDQGTSKRLTEQAFQNYLAVMMVALLALFPDVDTATFGTVALIATASWTLWVMIRLYQTVRQQETRTRRSIRRHISSVVGFGMLLASTLCMAFNWSQTVHLLAASTLVLLFSATAVSWELLRQIAKCKSRE